MKIIPYSNEDEEQTVRIETRKFNGHGVSISALDRAGMKICGLFFITEGGLHRIPDVSPELGFPLDSEGRIHITNE